MSKALQAFKALRSDIEQFDDHQPIDDSKLFSGKVPLFMKSYLVNWLRRFVEEHGDEVQNALQNTCKTPADDQPKNPPK